MILLALLAAAAFLSVVLTLGLLLRGARKAAGARRELREIDADPSQAAGA